MISLCLTKMFYFRTSIASSTAVLLIVTGFIIELVASSSKVLMAGIKLGTASIEVRTPVYTYMNTTLVKHQVATKAVEIQNAKFI